MTVQAENRPVATPQLSDRTASKETFGPAILRLILTAAIALRNIPSEYQSQNPDLRLFQASRSAANLQAAAGKAVH